LPQQQNGTQVLLGNLPLPILYTSNGQINVQVPFNTPVNTQYQISVQRDNLLSVPEQLVVAASQPGVFTVNQRGTGQGVIFKSDGVTLAQPGTPAMVGETVVIYCTGLGAVNPPIPEGTPAPPLPLSNTVNAVTVSIGGQDAVVQFSGLTPGFPGLYQINAVVPKSLSGEAIPVVVSVAGQTSPQVTMAVR
jgi:adhesin/invasin